MDNTTEPVSDPASVKPPLIDLFRGWPNGSLVSAADLANAADIALRTKSIYTQALEYGPDEGYEPLRRHVAEWLTEFYAPHAGPINADRICITGGASQNLACVLQVFTDPIYTRTIWMVVPTYYLACRIFDDAGFAGRLRAVPEDDEGIDIEFLERQLQLEEKLVNEKDKGDSSKPGFKSPQPWRKLYRSIIYGVPTFANPSMKVMSLKRREQLVRLARRYDSLIVTDDVYDFLQWSSSTTTPPPSVRLDRAVLPRLADVDRYLDGGPIHEWGNAVSNGSFSKILGPGVRTGWAEGTPKFSWGLSQTGSSRSGGAPSQLTATLVDQLVSSNVLKSRITNVLQPGYAARYHKLKSAIQNHLTPLGFTIPTTTSGRKGQDDGHHSEVAGGYFLWLHLPPSIRASDLAQRAIDEENLKIGSGTLFQVAGDPLLELEGRLCLCFAWEEFDALEEGIKRLARVAGRLAAENA